MYHVFSKSPGTLYTGCGVNMLASDITVKPFLGDHCERKTAGLSSLKCSRANNFDQYVNFEPVIEKSEVAGHHNVILAEKAVFRLS